MSIVVAVDVVESVDTENPGTNENQRLLNCHEGAFALPAHTWIVFPKR